MKQMVKAGNRTNISNRDQTYLPKLHPLSFSFIWIHVLIDSTNLTDRKLQKVEMEM